MTSSERAERLAELVKAAVERGPEHWDAFLDEECKSDPAMRAEVDSLLKHQKHVEQFIEPGALHLAADSFLHAGAERAGQIVGDYQVLSRLGIGGMGEVHLAQDTKLRRKVALKLVRAGMDTSEIVARFRQEEQILASLNHPNIAQLYGAGIAGGDVPFLVMEYIEGVRIDEYCKSKALSTAARLELFRKVCSAVLYAHQRLIIHRDLKPSNILVTTEGEPKLLDFGIAKLLEGQDAFTRMQTTLPGVMTPDYASPEQVRGEAITTSTDVYSLGVLLYELLTGQRPYRLKTRSPDEIARAITDQEPERPSTAIARGDGNSNTQTTNPKLLRDDLDNIVLMALRKEPSRRYASVGQFSEDVRRYLQGSPVLAHKDTLSYRATKFVKRHKIGVAAAAAIVLTLLGGIIATAWQAKRATDQARIAAEQARVAAQERDRARVETAKAARINDFLQNVLGFVSVGYLSPNPQKKNVATIAEALDEASRRAERELADQPEILAAVHAALGTSYAGQGKIDLAQEHQRASLDIRRKVLGPEHPDTAQSMVTVAEQLNAQGKYPEAEALSREAVAVYRRLRERGEMHPRWFTLSLNMLGVTLSRRGDTQSAHALMLEAVEAGANLTGIDRGLMGTIYTNLAVERGNLGDIDGAVDYLEKAIEEMRRLPEKPLTNLANSLSNLGSYKTTQGEYAQADALLREAEELCRQTVGEKHFFTTMAIIYLADNACEQGDFNRALGEINRAIAIQREILQEGHIDFARSGTILGKIHTRSGDPARGEEPLRNALALRTKALKPGHSATAFTQAMLGECLAAQNRYEEAETLLLESHTTMNKTMGANDPRTKRATMRLVKLYEAWGKPEEAERYRVSPAPPK
jgi:serine/threonine-protein kinase